MNTSQLLRWVTGKSRCSVPREWQWAGVFWATRDEQALANSSADVILDSKEGRWPPEVRDTWLA